MNEAGAGLINSKIAGYGESKGIIPILLPVQFNFKKNPL
jgi:hypothetical protein